MAPPPFTFERNALRSNGSFALRFIAGPPFAGLILKRRPFYSIAPRRDNLLAAAPHTLARECLARPWTFALVRAVNSIRVISTNRWHRDEPGLGHPRYFERAPRTSA